MMCRCILKPLCIPYLSYEKSSDCVAVMMCRFILKSILYDPAIRTSMLILPCEPAKLDGFLRSVNISSKRPFMLQQLMHGPEFSCYALADKGRLVAHADTSAQLSNLNFKHLGRPEIQDFTARICSALKLDGQVQSPCLLLFLTHQLSAAACLLACACMSLRPSPTCHFEAQPSLRICSALKLHRQVQSSCLLDS